MTHNYRIPVVKLSIVRDGSVSSEFNRVNCSQDTYNLLKGIIGNNDREEMIALLLDAKFKVLAVHSISIGSLTQAIVHPREVFKAAIISNAASIIIAHNHPSGDSNPSPEDRELTKRLSEAGKLLGIPLTDHLVIGDGNYYSFADQGMLN